MAVFMYILAFKFVLLIVLKILEFAFETHFFKNKFNNKKKIWKFAALKSKEMLLEATYITIKKIVTILGNYDTAYFYKVFKKLYLSQ